MSAASEACQQLMNALANAGADQLGDNVTMLQLRDAPYTVVELWWESEGKLRFSYDELGEDVMCVWYPYVPTNTPVSLCKLDDSHTAVCVRILHVCPYTTKYVSSCYYVCPDAVSVWKHGFKMYESSTCTFWHQQQLFLSVWKHDDSKCMKEIVVFFFVFFHVI